MRISYPSSTEGSGALFVSVINKDIKQKIIQVFFFFFPSIYTDSWQKAFLNWAPKKENMENKKITWIGMNREL